MPSGIWNRFRDEVRSVSSRTQRSARRAFETSVLRVDLVSLRRRRRQVLADLGERLLALWDRGALADASRDPEMLRLRERLQGVDAAIAAKEAEIRRLRASDEAPAAPTPPGATPDS